MNRQQIHVIAVVSSLISVAIVFASLFFPALYLRAPNGASSEWPGGMLFFFGWVRILSMMWDGLGWLANVLLMLAVLDSVNRQYRSPVIFSAIGFALAMTSFLMKEVWLNEAGTKGVIVGYGAGFYLWMSAIALNLVTSTVVYALWLRAPDRNQR